jgi:NTP pyrophosphatase (non-canonical NTP hydrolase)
VQDAIPASCRTIRKGRNTMKDLKISEIVAMQNALQNRMRDKWLPIIPENGHFLLLWMFEEMGEIVAIVKKRGNNAIMKDETVRAAFIEELSDVLMYFIDMMTCYGVSAEELSEAFTKKHEKNMRRDFATEHKKYLNSDNA